MSAETHHVALRRLRQILLFFIGLWLLYLGLFNLFLGTPLGPRLLSWKPEKLHVQWERGWTLKPGTLHVRGFELRSQTPKVQWWLSVEEGRLHLLLPALVMKRFTASDVRVSGVSFRSRRRLDALEDPPATLLEGMAPIPGLENPPKDPPPPPPQDKSWRWRFRMRNISVSSADELWVDGYRLRGKIGVRGRFRYRVRGELALSNVSLKVEDGRLGIGGEEGAEDVQVTVRGRLKPVVATGRPAIGLLRYLNLEGTAAGDVSSLSFLDVLFSELQAVDLGGEASVEARLAVVDGVLRPGTEVQADSEGVEVGYLDYTARGAGTVVGRIVPDDDLPAERRAKAETRSEAEGETFSEAPGGAAAAGDPGPEARQEGRTKGTGGDEGGAGPGSGPGGGIPAEGESRGPSGPERRAESAGRSPSRPRPGAPGRLELAVDLTSFKLQREDLGEPHIEGEGFSLSGTSRRLDLTDPFGDLEARIRMPPSRVPDLTVYNADLPAGSTFAFEGGEGEISAEFLLRAADGSAEGRVEMKTRGAAARYGDTRFSGDLHLRTRLAEGDVKARRFRFDGSSLDLEGVQVEGQKRSAGSWWGRFEFPDGKVELRPNPAVETRVEGRLRDTAPILALVAEKKKVLSWVDSFLQVENVTVGAELTADERRFQVEDLQAEAEHLEALGDFTVAGERKEGIFYFRYRRLSAGVELEAGERDWKLFRSRKWFDERRSQRR